MGKEIKNFMRKDVENVISNGQVDVTLLAENAAHFFNHDEWLDEENHIVWEIAWEIAHEFSSYPNF